MLDQSRLLHLFNQKQELVNRFINLFKTQTPLQLADLQRALTKHDNAAAEVLAHGLKTQCRYIGLDDIALQFEDLEMHPEDPKALEKLAQLELLILPYLS